jgi:hypothetical protein
MISSWARLGHNEYIDFTFTFYHVEKVDVLTLKREGSRHQSVDNHPQDPAGFCGWSFEFAVA